MAKRQKTAQINLRVDPALKERAEKAASDDHRSLTSLIEKLLIDYLRKHRKEPVSEASRLAAEVFAEPNPVLDELENPTYRTP